MKNVNLWESSLKNKYIFFDNTNELFTYLRKNNNHFVITIKNDYHPEENPIAILDNNNHSKNTHMTYTDATHPVAVPVSSFSIYIYVYSDFFETHKEEFIKYAKEQLNKEIGSAEVVIIIPDYIYNSEVLNTIVSNPNLKKTDFILKEIEKDITLTAEEISIIKYNHLSFSIDYRNGITKRISNNKLIEYYTEQELATTKGIILSLPLSNEEINNFTYINDNCLISIGPKSNTKQDEPAYFKEIINIFNIIKNHNHKYNIKICANNRELLRQSNLLNKIPDNVNLTINNNGYNYDMPSIKKEEDILEKLVAPIRDSNLSPLEKFLAVYNIAKQFKKYKESPNTKKEHARLLRYILDDDNNYIVCVGFANLLEELLNRVGIPSMKYHPGIDLSYDEDNLQSEKNIDLSGHCRNIIRIDDDKYNIHGYYIVDSTWDNDMENDIYLNALMTFNHKKEARRLEKLTDEDLLLDFNSFEDCQNKINYLFKKQLNDQLYNNKYVTEKINSIKNKYQDLINKSQNRDEKLSYMKAMNNEITKTKDNAYINTYQAIYKNILNILKHTNKEKYNEFYDKYYSKLYTYHASLENVEEIMNELTIEYANYIIPLTNKEVSLDTILKAAKVVKQVINGYTKREANEWYNITKEINERRMPLAFPYIYKPNNKEAYLEPVKNNSHKK